MVLVNVNSLVNTTKNDNIKEHQFHDKENTQLTTETII
jgi:hypothetical protein